ncbi:MuDR family transposase [Corchorus olitorius]|uniref:MuDR family transposase n=1 Tax=Corchorus olitorius TaxID=93759 RepID=A0A1R3JLD8_9ROSI|nr:MuDR family transposase [Corchorus olitorius]
MGPDLFFEDDELRTVMDDGGSEVEFDCTCGRVASYRVVCMRALCACDRKLKNWPP